jgi:hypothetical protein
MTTTHTHTSGPWCIHRGYANAQTITITDDNGESWEFTHTHIGQGDKIIAQVQHQSKDSGWPHVHDVGEMWANARLIAAAPDMLDALRVIHANAGESPEWIRTRIDAVIAKAEGKDA